ncbi:hypothetical protein HCH_06646 [Hahella chejuensis KCTC 2396]|uniref:DUF1722 domain-containing protein n=2 Tax=Hahella chejuensis TaxID=158327 RepID=Q2S7U5_HAHCH|nr:hypothetical protein HCH_06646 [Hahella chejuensis KCTC 2396]
MSFFAAHASTFCLCKTLFWASGAVNNGLIKKTTVENETTNRTRGHLANPMPQFLFDIDPGYLSLPQLQHQLNMLQGAIRKPEKIQQDPHLKSWRGHVDALMTMYNLVVSEINLRQNSTLPYIHASGESLIWPARPGIPVEEQWPQAEAGARLPSPRNDQALWAQHKYSVMARNQGMYQSLGRAVAAREIGLGDLAEELVAALRVPPPLGGLRNAVWHMWGYISQFSQLKPDNTPLPTVFREIQLLAGKHQSAYLLNSTALGELAYWCWLFEGKH